MYIRFIIEMAWVMLFANFWFRTNRISKHSNNLVRYLKRIEYCLIRQKWQSIKTKKLMGDK